MFRSDIKYSMIYITAAWNMSYSAYTITAKWQMVIVHFADNWATWFEQQLEGETPPNPFSSLPDQVGEQQRWVSICSVPSCPTRRSFVQALTPAIIYHRLYREYIEGPVEDSCAFIDMPEHTAKVSSCSETTNSERRALNCSRISKNTLNRYVECKIISRLMRFLFPWMMDDSTNIAEKRLINLKIYT